MEFMPSLLWFGRAAALLRPHHGAYCSGPDAFAGAALHSPHSFDALRNWGERGMGNVSQRKTYAGRIKHPDDATEPATLDPPGSIAHLFRARSGTQDVCRFALQSEVLPDASPAGFSPCRVL